VGACSLAHATGWTGAQICRALVDGRVPPLGAPPQMRCHLCTHLKQTDNQSRNWWMHAIALSPLLVLPHYTPTLEHNNTGASTQHCTSPPPTGCACRCFKCILQLQLLSEHKRCCVQVQWLVTCQHRHLLRHPACICTKQQRRCHVKLSAP
jgi:hypothetical protein